MANYTFDKIEYNSNNYIVEDSDALHLSETSNQTITGPVTIGELTAGSAVISGNASIVNGLQVDKINGVTVGTSPKFTDTNTEVSTLTLASGSTAGTSLSYGGKYTLTAGTKTVSFTMPSSDNTNTTYTFANGTNGFTVTPSGGTAQTVTVTPSISNNVTGSGTSGYLTKWNGANTITNGPALGSDATKFLNNKGEWATPAGSTYSAGTGLSLSGSTFNHSNSVTAGTAGTSSATSSTDRTLAVPYVTYDAQGHVTGSGTHTHTISSFPEAYLSWGGKNFIADYGPLDAAMIDVLGANRFAFLKAAGLTFEYSTDAGSTWTDYGLTDAQKVAVFSSGGSVYLGKHSSAGTSTVNDMLRITIDTGAASIYTVLNKIAIYMSTSGNTTWVKIEKALQSTPTTYTNVLDWTSISGWSGWNIYNIGAFTTYGNTASSQYGRIRFSFKQTVATSSSYCAAGIWRIMGFGGVGWTVPSNMARDGHLYSYDSSQNASFPAQITATQFNGPATKLGSSNVGAADRPIYLSAGSPSQTTYRMAGTNASATTAVSIDTDLDSGIWYVSGTSSIYNQSDGVAIVNKYSNSWITQIYQDYRTGQIALRGKNSGTWQAWRKVLDSSNWSSFITIPTVPSATGSSTTGISASTTATKTTLGTASSVTGVSGSTTASSVTVGSHSTDYGVKSAGSGSFTSGTFNGGSGSFTQGSFTGGSLSVSNHVMSFSPATHGADSHTHTAATHGADSHTHTAPTLGSKVPTVSASNVTVPVAASSAVSVPNVSVASATVTITDPGHTHPIS